MTRKWAAIYARYSSELQHEHSIDDQCALCQNLAKREGLSVRLTCDDRAKSGASMFERDGLKTLIAAVERREFDVLIVESLDRLSRDQADMLYLFKRCQYSDIKILTQSGYVDAINAGMNGIMNEQFLVQLGDKVRRGHAGRAREGKFPGALTYGYCRIPVSEDQIALYKGKRFKPGLREVDPMQAAIVVRIFTEYAAGRSPRAIAMNLTAEGIPSPGGLKAWSPGHFTGNSNRHGMLGNRLYIGEIEWNKCRTVRHYKTKKRTKRRADPDELIIAPAPHLRIIPDSLWEAAQAVRTRRAIQHFGGDGKLGPRTVLPRNEYLLAGLLRCGCCGGHMRIGPGGKNRRVGCAAAQQVGTCLHTRTYDLDKLDRTVINGMLEHLTDPETIAARVAGFHERYAERQNKARVDGAAATKRRDRLQIELGRMLVAIREIGPSPELIADYKRLQTERDGLDEQLRLINVEGGSDNVIPLHPKTIDVYRASIKRLHAALTSNPAAPEHRAAFRNVIDSIVVHHTAKRMPYEVDAYGRVGAISGFDLFPDSLNKQQAVDAKGKSHNSITSDPRSEDRTYGNNAVLLLGHWQSAA